jgi:hypothetical protein
MEIEMKRIQSSNESYQIKSYPTEIIKLAMD